MTVHEAVRVLDLNGGGAIVECTCSWVSTPSDPGSKQTARCEAVNQFAAHTREDVLPGHDDLVDRMAGKSRRRR